MNRIIPIIVVIAILAAIIRHVGLFPVIFLFIIGFSIYNQLKKASGKSPGEKPEWKKKLDDALGQIKSELDAQSAQRRQKPDATAWEQLSVETEPEIEPLELDAIEPVERDGLDLRESRKTVSQVRRGKQKTDSLRTPVGPAAPSGEARPAGLAENLYGIESTESRINELRKAVVWSEILAKPLALRGRRR